jgi:methyl-accepting chemotaxis protein
MKQIREQMESIAESIVRLSEQSQAIGEIMLTVNDLAEQSNLLAVNASIEAAKAGEQGKGFAVVAQEVRNLADQSKQATTQVRSILSEIQKATNATVMVTEQGSKAVETGVRLSGLAGESVQKLTEGIAEAAQAATQIAASSQQQMAGMNQVALAIESIKTASTQNVASTRQTETAAKNIEELGRRLKGLVSLYKVENRGLLKATGVSVGKG